MGDQEDVIFLNEVLAVIKRESGGLDFVIDDGGPLNRDLRDSGPG